MGEKKEKSKRNQVEYFTTNFRRVASLKRVWLGLRSLSLPPTSLSESETRTETDTIYR